MARRKQKFTFVHLLLMAALVIWLPTLVGRLAGIPDEDVAEPSVEFEATPAIDVEAISHVQEQDFTTTEDRQFRPAPAGLRLTETLISSSGKTAVINGLAFREGQLIDQTGYPLRIRSILVGRVILEGDGGLYELRRQSVF